MKFMTPDTVPLDDIELFYRWFSVIRLLGVPAVGVVIAILWSLNLLSFDPRGILFILIPAYLAITGLWLFVLSQKIHPQFFLYVQMIVDLIIITLGIYVTGDVETEFIFLYAPIIISATIISLWSTLTVSLGAVALFGSLAYADRGKFFATGQGDGLGIGEEAIRLFILLFLIIVIAFQNYYYVSRIKRKDAELLRIKDEFLFRTVHDLRSPTTNISWLISKYANSDIIKEIPELAKDLLSLGEMNSRMARLIGDLLHIAQGESPTKQLSLQPLDIVELMKGSLEEVLPALERKHVKLLYKPQVSPRVMADRGSVREVLINLLDNAIKYNKEGGKLEMSHKIVGKMLQTTVSDTGRGIPRADIKKIFTPYFRAPNTKGISGTGLGMYIVKKLVEHMGGNIEITSAEGVGTTVSVNLPLAPTHE